MQVWHMSGAGNDFMVIDARGQDLDFSSLARTLCRQTHADGFMALDNSETADFRLHFYNADGSRGEMCGNGARCICRFAYELGLVADNMTVQTDAGLICGSRLDDNLYRVRLNKPSIADFDRLPGVCYIELGDPGIPHCVKELKELSFDSKDELLPLAIDLRYAKEFPKGVNVSFYRQLESGKVQVLTYERYVEDYTLACGTGCGSIAVALWLQGKLPGGKLTAENQGGTLQITLEGENGAVSALYLEGPTQVLSITQY